MYHGVLMQTIDPAYAHQLHEDGLRPYSQCVFQEGKKSIWQINTLCQEAHDKIIAPVYSDSFSHFEISHNKEEVWIEDKHLETTKIQEMIDRYYFGDCSRTVDIQFLTPTAFKQAGKYVFYPDIGLIYQSLINRFNQFAEKEMITGEETFEDIVKNTEIISYRLHSVSFPLEGVKIPSFLGTIKIRIHGPAPLVNLSHLLLHFGRFSGVGIKTALGMGKMDVKERGRKIDRP